MIKIEPISQMNLFGLNKYMLEMIKLYTNNNLPNKILFSGQKGLGKATLAFHFINFVLSQNEEYSYDCENFSINPENPSFKTILNKSNPNFILLDVELEKKFIDISQIRNLITNLNKSSFNLKPRFILIDNIEFLNINSINALLKILEEPSNNIHFILINNNKRILPTLLSRCLNFKISLSNKESFDIANKLLDNKINDFINKSIINYYMSPGNIYNLIFFANNNNYDLANTKLEYLIKKLIINKHYKKNDIIKFIIFDLIESYFNKINFSFSSKITEKYSYFIKRISETRKYNLDEETLFNEFEENLLNG